MTNPARPGDQPRHTLGAPMSDDDDYDWWTATDRETERERIEAYAETQRTKWPNDPRPHPGLARRGAISWFEVGKRLAEIQEQYDLADDPYDRIVGQRAMFAIWPAILANVGIRSVRGTEKKRKKAREKFIPILHAMGMMGNKLGFCHGPFDYPIIEIRRRNKNQRQKGSLKDDIGSDNDYKAEVIGRAVIQEYRRYPDRPSLDAAFISVAALDEVEGVATLKRATVEKRYHRYRKLAHERGYADARSFWAEVEERPWPDDHVWLSDFPPN